MTAEQPSRNIESSSATDSQPTVSLLSLCRAAFETAKTWYWRGRLSQYATLAVGFLVMIVPDTWTSAAYALTIVALILQGLTWCLFFKGKETQDVARVGLERARIVDGLGSTHELLAVTDLETNLRGTLGTQGMQAARKFEDEHETKPYFASAEPVGRARLHDHLQESAFYSKHLFRAAAKGSFIRCALVGVGVLIVSLIALPLTAENTSLLIAKGIVVFVGFLVGYDEIGRALVWSTAASAVEAIDQRLERLDFSEIEPMLAVFIEYSLATGGAAPIPNGVYARQEPRLNRLWSGRIAQHNNDGSSEA